MKLSQKQREVLEKLGEGWVLNEYGNTIWIWCSLGQESVHANTLRSLWDRKLIVLSGSSGGTGTYKLTTKGRQTLQDN